MEDLIDQRFAALADATRRAILTRLREGEATVMELAAPFDISQPAITRHLKVLEAAGLIERRRVGTSRPCRLKPDELKQIEDWCAAFRVALDDRFDRLDLLFDEEKDKT